MPEVPAMHHLMGAYFHQDWDVDGDEWDVVDLFIRNEPRSAAGLPDEIARVLDSYPREADLKDFVLNDLGAYYLADTDGATFRQWLTQIADRVRAVTSVGGS